MGRQIICLVRDLDLGNLLSQVDARDHKPGGGWPPYYALGYRMAIVCAPYTARYTSVPSPLRGRNTDNPSQTSFPEYRGKQKKKHIRVFSLKNNSMYPFTQQLK